MDKPKFETEKQGLFWAAIYFARAWHGASAGEAVRDADAALALFAERDPSKEEGEIRGSRRPR